MSLIPNACNHPDCSVSTGICGSLTFGFGRLDPNGYWARPCGPCARAHEQSSPADGPCWPFDGMPQAAAPTAESCAVEFFREALDQLEDRPVFFDGKQWYPSTDPEGHLVWISGYGEEGGETITLQVSFTRIP